MFVNKNFKLVLISYILLGTSVIFAGNLEEYTLKINGQCPNINPLVIKKSLIELAHDQNCRASFTALLLKDCPQLTCPTLVDYWSLFNASKSGAVIGN